jgi:hypothetical protein
MEQSPQLMRSPLDRSNQFSGGHVTPGYTRPHPEALYYHIAVDSLARARATDDRWLRAQSVAQVLVFSALCLEAYANQRLEDLGLGDCESLPLEKKWRSLPRLAGATGFNESQMPFQGFKELVGLRNRRLVHFHPNEEILHGVARPGRTYHSDIFQDVDLAARAVQSMTDMIKEYRRIASPNEQAPDFVAGAKYTSFVASSTTVAMEWVASREAAGPEPSPSS